MGEQDAPRYVTRTCRYDRLHRLISQTNATGVVAFAYDSSGNLVSCSTTAAGLVPGEGPPQDFPPATAPARRFCTGCGAPLTPGKSFCGNCGRNI